MCTVLISRARVDRHCSLSWLDPAARAAILFLSLRASLLAVGVPIAIPRRRAFAAWRMSFLEGIFTPRTALPRAPTADELAERDLGPRHAASARARNPYCLLYTSDAADE